MISGLYVVLTLVVAPFEFGPLQFRVSEALTVWAVLGYDYAFGLTLGCALANLVGVLSGANPAGMMDVVFGSMATLIAGILAYHFRNVKTFDQPLLSASMAVIVNAIIIPLELVIMMSVPESLAVFAAQIFITEAAVIFLIGVPLFSLYQKRVKE